MSTAPEDAEPGDSGRAGLVYLIHFDTAYKHARHYTGFTTDLPDRMEDHRKGRGARLMEVIKEAGISWRVVRTWPGTKDLERAIKDRHEAPRLCPECTPNPRPVTGGRSAARRADAQAVTPVARQHPAPRAPRQELPATARVRARDLPGDGVTPPGPEPQPHHQPGRAAEAGPLRELPPAWPGRVDEAAACRQYRDLWEVTDALLEGWLAQPEAGGRDTELEIG
jgi:predicted GIY-YIG superfamily endonuclease